METKINFGYLVFLSVVAALGGFLFGYDTAVISCSKDGMSDVHWLVL